MTLAADLAGDVLAALAEFGRAAMLRKVTEGTYDPETGTTTGGGVTDAAVTIGPLLSYRDREIDGSRIQADDRKVVMATAGVSSPPDNGDRIVIGGAVMTIVSHKLYEVNGTTVAYVMQVRNA